MCKDIDSYEIEKKLEVKYKDLIRETAALSTIDHDINNPLTIISLSISRIAMAGEKYGDEKLIKYCNQMTKALSRIDSILMRVKKIKDLDLIKEELRISNEKTNFNS